MKKLIINLKINDYIIKEKGTIENNILSFIDNDELKTSININLKDNILIRENKDIKIEINFNDKKVKYLLKEINKEFINNVKILKLKKQENNLEIIYEIENNTFNLSLNYKEEV